MGISLLYHPHFAKFDHLKAPDVKIKHSGKICHLFHCHLTGARFLPHREVTLVAFAQRPSDAGSTLNVMLKATLRTKISNVTFARKNLLEGKLLRQAFAMQVNLKC